MSHGVAFHPSQGLFWRIVILPEFFREHDVFTAEQSAGEFSF
jgi:hypothetical protein